MRLVFEGESVQPKEKVRALDLAIRAAKYMNRFAAMDTCRSIITSVQDESLGIHVASVLLENRETFILNIEISECQCDSIRNALRQLQQQK